MGTWIVLIISPVIVTKLRRDSEKQDLSSANTPWLREAVAIGCILFLFELAWGVQVAILSTDPSMPIAVGLQSVFIVSSACLGLVTLLHFCFLQLQVQCFHKNKVLEEKDAAHASDNEYSSPTECKRASVKVITLPVKPSVCEESQVVSKLADL